MAQSSETTPDPPPHGNCPPAAELKEWAISWLRSDERWIRPRTTNGDDDRLLNLHRFDMRQEEDDESRCIPFVMANFIPGGKFVVVLYADGQINLKEITIESDDSWGLLDVAQYGRDDSERSRITFWSQLLTETNLGHPLVAYVDQDQEKYDRSSLECRHHSH